MIYHGSQESDPHVWLTCHGFGLLGERRQEEEEKLAENSSDKNLKTNNPHLAGGE